MIVDKKTRRGRTPELCGYAGSDIVVVHGQGGRKVARQGRRGGWKMFGCIHGFT